MATRYLEILATQQPFDIGPDNNNRHQFSCNYYFTAAAPVVDFEEEVAKLLVTAGLGTLYVGSTNTGNILIGRGAKIPDGAGPFTLIIKTSGMAPLETHDAQKYERLTCQIVVRATSYASAKSRAMAIWRALDGQRNVSVTAP